jgi:hypothetical protein
MIEIDNSPQAKFVKNLIRKDHPELTEEQVEKLWQERRDKAKEDDIDCLACGS